MRITQNMITNDLLSSINKNQNELAKIQNQVSTGKSVNKPSDNPLNFQNGRKLEDLLSKNVQYQSNVESGLFQARYAQEAIDQSVDKMIQLKQIVVQGANDGVIEDQDMATLAEIVKGMKEDLVTFFNTNADGRYLFGGTNTMVAPFEINDDGDVVYNGNSENLTARVNDNTEVGISINGSDLQNMRNGESIFGLLDEVETLLRAGDSTGLNAKLSDVDIAVEHISNIGSQIGSNINRMDFVNEQFEVGNINLQSEVSRLVDADYAESLSQIQKLQVSYQAALSANASMLQTNLLNFLR